MSCPSQSASKTISDVLSAHPGIRTAYLNVAQGGVYLQPTAVQTVLGSCLSVCFHVPARNIGAIFHAFLPRCADFDSCFEPVPYRYVDTAIATVMESLGDMHVGIQDIRVKLVGGANALVDSHSAIGRKNVAVAREVLANLGLKVVRADVGGPRGRKIIYLTGTGDLFVNCLQGIAP